MAGMNHRLHQCICLAAFLTCAPAMHAMTIAEAGPPANLPPANFSGLQFVDNRGCIYIRTNGVGPESWAPRVARTGEVMCGFVPSLASIPMKELSDPIVVPAGTEAVAPNPTVVPETPSGYKPAWGDGRLNPLRGVRSGG